MSEQKVYFKGIRNEIITLIGNAKFDIKIAVAWITDTTIIRALESARHRNVNISMVFYDDKINDKEFFEGLFLSGADIRYSKKLMHNKFCIIDNEIVINGSYNWTNKAQHNNENILVTFGNREIAEQFRGEFEKIFTKCQSIKKDLALSAKQIWLQDDDFEHYYSQKIELNRRKVGFPYWYKDDQKRVVFIESEEAEYGYFRRAYFAKIAKQFGTTLYSSGSWGKSDGRKIRRYIDAIAAVTGVALTTEKFQIFEDVCNFEDIENSPINKTGNFAIEYGDIIALVNAKKKEIIEEQSFKQKLKLQRKEQQAFYIHDKEAGTHTIIDENFEILFQTEREVVCFAQGKGAIIRVKKEDSMFDRPAHHLRTFISKLSFYEFVSFDKNNEFPLFFNDYYLNDEKDEFYFIEFPIFYFSNNDIITPLDYCFYPLRARKNSENRLAISNKVFENCSLKYYILGGDPKRFYYTKPDLKGHFFISDLTSTNSYSNENRKKCYANNLQFCKLMYRRHRFGDVKIYEEQYKIPKDRFIKILKSYKSVYKNNPVEAFNADYKIQERKREIERKKNNEVCYVATMVYGNPNHEDVVLLRGFRDNYLYNNIIGSFFVWVYYLISPIFVKTFKENLFIKNTCKKVVHYVVRVIKSKYYSDAS